MYSIVTIDNNIVLQSSNLLTLDLNYSHYTKKLRDRGATTNHITRQINMLYILNYTSQIYYKSNIFLNR